MQGLADSSQVRQKMRVSGAVSSPKASQHCVHKVGAFDSPFKACAGVVLLFGRTPLLASGPAAFLRFCGPVSGPYEALTSRLCSLGKRGMPSMAPGSDSSTQRALVNCLLRQQKSFSLVTSHGSEFKTLRIDRPGVLGIGVPSRWTFRWKMA